MRAVALVAVLLLLVVCLAGCGVSLPSVQVEDAEMVGDAIARTAYPADLDGSGAIDTTDEWVRWIRTAIAFMRAVNGEGDTGGGNPPDG